MHVISEMPPLYMAGQRLFPKNLLEILRLNIKKGLNIVKTFNLIFIFCHLRSSLIRTPWVFTDTEFGLLCSVIWTPAAAIPELMIVPGTIFLGELQDV